MTILDSPAEIVQAAVPGTDRQVLLRLDGTQFTQRLILDHLHAGVPYEWQTAGLLGQVLKAGDTFIDVGAHVGYFTLLASELVGPTGSVLSFEPEPGNFAHLLEHVQLNRLGNVMPFNWALSEAPGVMDLHLNADNDGGHALWDVGSHPFNRLTREQRCVRPTFVSTLDAALPHSVARVKAIKIDTEGNELGVLRGAQALLNEAEPLLLCEINRFGLEHSGASEEAVRSLLRSLGYVGYVFVPGKTELVLLGDDESLVADSVFNMVFVKRGAEARLFA
jgi:FkbM family methyltransferase